MNTKKLSALVLSLLALMCVCLFGACTNDDGGDDNDGYLAGDEVGEYYYITDGKQVSLDDYKLTITADGAVTLLIDGTSMSATCLKDSATAAALSLVLEDGTTVSAGFSNNVVSLTYNDTTYRFYKDVSYTVTFDSQGGTSVPSQTVKNGLYATEPTDPVLDGKIFIAWCTTAAYSGDSVYYFASAQVTGNLTLYACYTDSSSGEYLVTYDLNYDGATATSLYTTDGVATLPADPTRSGYTFMGWYVSDYDDPDKLTYKYEDEVLYENTTLYAVWKSTSASSNFLAISITDEGIEWTDLGYGSYNVYIRDSEGLLVNDESFSTSVNYLTLSEFDFASCTAGEYTVEVTRQSVSATAYYKNKALAKVSSFAVTGGQILTYNSVANATEYLITVTCGNTSHNHTLLTNGASLAYNFANCDMPRGGIKFTVTAHADGYLDSVSDVYTFERALTSVENLVVNDEGMLTWTAVENATYYLVTVTAAGETETYNVSDTTLSLKNYAAGNMTLTVAGYANGYYTPEATSISYNKTTLSAPENVKVSGYTLMWDAVDGATGYTVKVGDTEYTATGTTLTLTEAMFSGTDWTVAVRANSDSANSFYTEPVQLLLAKNVAKELDLSYSNGYITWNNVLGVDTYRLTVNGNVVNYDDGTNKVALNATSGGEYAISLTVMAGSIAKTSAISVQLYTVYYESNGGTSVSDVYLARGDSMMLPTSEKAGYTFDGWYNAVNGAASNGKEYKNSSFTASNDITVYANWSPVEYTVTLNWKDGTQQLSTTQSVKFGEAFTLQVPDIEANGTAFEGWYNGSIKLTDATGASIDGVVYSVIGDMTLEANFVEVLSFELVEAQYAYTQNLGNTDAYSVSKGAYISVVSEVTIPAYYQGLPVTIIDAEAFKSTSTLKVVNIPDTVQLIETGIKGLYNSGSAFYSCANLEAINVYATEASEGRKGKYWSDDGILYEYSDEDRTVSTLVGVPKAKTGEVVVSDSVTEIRLYAFANATKITKVTVPSSVTYVGKAAFTSNTNLTQVVFEESSDGNGTLTFADEAFTSCTNLLEISLPSTVTSFNPMMFKSCSKLANVYFSGTAGSFYSDDGVVMSKDEEGVVTLVYYPIAHAGTTYTIPSGVTKIGNNAFTNKYANTSSTTVVVGYNDYNFTGNKNLTSVTIPAWVTYIGEDAFRGCTKIESVTFESDAGDNAALTIADRAFYGLTNTEFTSVTLPSQLVSLGNNAFGNCTKLVSVTINSGDCTYFTSGAFAALTQQLTAGTTYVTDIYVGENVSNLEFAGVFGSKLATVVVDDNNQNYASLDDEGQEGVVFNKDVTSIVFVPLEKEGAYVVPSTVTTIADGVFRNRDKITSVTIGKNVATIGDQAFYDADGITTVTFEDRSNGDGTYAELTIGDQVFYGCAVLTDITLPEGLTSVGIRLFYQSYKIASITIPSTLTEIAYGYDSTVNADIFDMFYNYSSSALTAINVADGNTAYGSQNGILYKKDDSGALTTLVFCPCAVTGTIDIAPTVTSIESLAFKYSKASKITFSEGITEGSTLTFGSNVFYYSSIEEIELPSGLTEIGAKLFASCTTLKSITIPNTVETVGDRAFYYCKSLEEVIFENGNDEKDEDGNYLHPLTFADGYSSSGYHGVFESCYALKSLSFPARTTYLGDYLMGYYSDQYGTTTSKLESVAIPSSIEYIGVYAFYYCKSLTNVNFYENGVSKLADYTKTLRTKESATSSFGSGTTYAALYYTFYNAPIANTVKLPESSSEDGYSVNYAFYYADLTEIELPLSVSSLKSAFYYCTDLKTVTMRTSEDGSVSKLQSVGDNTFYGCKALESVELPVAAETAADDGTVTYSGLESIGVKAFYNCTSLKSIVIPASVETISNSAFYNCVSLASITFATYQTGDYAGMSSINTIDYQAFYATAITEFTFPVSVSEKIALGGGTTAEKSKGRLFASCINLTTVTLSKSVTDVDYVFEGATSLEKIVVADDNESLASSEGSPYLYTKDKTGIVYVYGQISEGEYTIAKGITSIGTYAFKGQTGITSLTIPYTVMSIGTGAFMDCTNLESVVFENTATHPSALMSNNVGTYLFSGCDKLQSVTIPATTNFNVIPDYMFEGTAITEVTIPAGITEIGEYAFRYCENLTTVTIEEGSQLKTIGKYAFYGCTSLTGLAVPAGTPLTEIATYAFYGCTSFKSITFAEDSVLTTISAYAFYDCDLTEIKIPATVTTIAGSVFLCNENLATVEFLKDSNGATAITTITGNAFGSSTADKACSALTSITIPESVTTIGSSAFTNCTSLATVTFEGDSALTSLGSSVFKGCTALTSIAIPSGVTKLDASLFEGCTSLATITIPDDSAATTVGKYTFKDTAISEITIPSKVTTIGAGAFEGCANLLAINIPAAVKTMNGNIFSGCTALTTVTFEACAFTSFGTYTFAAYDDYEACTSLTTIEIPAKVQKLGNYMFKGCTALTTVTFASGSALNYLGTYAFQDSGLETIELPSKVTVLGTSSTAATVTSKACTFYGATKLTSVTFKGKVTKIGGHVFEGCSSLVIDIPSTVTLIGDYAFKGVANTEFTIPKGLTAKNLGNNPFADCQNLTTFTVASGNSVYTVVDGALVSDSTTVVCYPAGLSGNNGSLTLPSGATLGSYALSGCNNITSITLAEGLTAVASYAFAELGENIKSITLPESVTEIGSYAFYNSAYLESVVMGNSVTDVNNYAFYGCTSLKSVTMSSALTYIGNYAFYNCSSLESIVIPAGVTQIGSATTAGYVFTGCTSLTSVDIKGELTMIGAYAFKDCASLDTFTIQSTVTSLGYGAFSGTGIKEITIPETVTTIAGSSTAQGILSGSAVEKVTVNSVLQAAMFYNCANLTSVTFGTANEYTSLPDYLFQNCTSLANIDIPDTVTTFGKYVFAGCTSLKTVDLHEGITFLGTYTFKESGLESIVIPSTVTNLGSSATTASYSSANYLFDGCTGLTSVTLPDGLDVIGAYTFRNCTALTSITLPESVSTIGSYAFSGCTALTTINVPSSLTTIGTYAFQDTTSIKELVFNNVLTAVYLRAFAGWTADQTIKFAYAESVSEGWTNSTYSWYTDCNATFVWEYTADTEA